MTQAGERPVGIGLIGTGAIARLSHAPMLRAMPEAELIAVHDLDLGRAETLARECGVETCCGELAALLDEPRVEAVVVTTANAHHRVAVEAAAAAGKHVFCEKPLATTLADARAMIEACRRAGVILQVGFNQRFWSQVRIAKQLIDAGFIGRVHGFRSVYSEKWTAYPAATRYRYDLTQSGGATIIDLTVHRIDLIRHLLGDVRSLVAELRHRVLPEPVDDNVWLLANLVGGATGCLSSDRWSPAIGDGTDIYGTEGTIHLATETINPFHAVPLAVYTEKPADALPEVLREAHYPAAWWKSFEGGWITLQPPRRNPYLAELQAFCRAVREGGDPPVTGEDGYRALEIVQAAYLSARGRSWIDLPLPEDTPLTLPNY